MALAALAGCAARPYTPPSRQTATTMPHPGGCFVQVWDRPNFAGTFDYINGPRHYPSLRDMPGGREWSDRIRSAKVGPDATVMLYANETAQGAAMMLVANADYPYLPESLSGAAESATIACASAGEAAD